MNIKIFRKVIKKILIFFQFKVKKKKIIKMIIFFKMLIKIMIFRILVMILLILIILIKIRISLAILDLIIFKNNKEINKIYKTFIFKKRIRMMLKIRKKNLIYWIFEK